MSEPEKRTVEAQDFMGKTIQAGDTICYPVRQGSSMWLKKIVVGSVRDTPHGPGISGVNENGRRVTIKNLNTCVVVETK